MEEARIAVRNVRDDIKKTVEHMEKEKEIAEDERYQLQDELDRVQRQIYELSSEVAASLPPAVAWNEARGSARKAGASSAHVSNATGVEMGLKEESRRTTVPWKALAAPPPMDWAYES